jgi:Domain of unknown function (DUF4249)
MFKPLLLFIVVCFITVACIDKINVEYDLSADLLTIDGIVTDQNVIEVSIQYSRSLEGSTYIDPVRNCIVEVLVNGQSVKLTESLPGIYTEPNKLKGAIGKTYQLRFTTPQGVKYESSIEKLNAAPPIDKIYHEFNEKGQLNNTGKVVIHSTSDVYIDFEDPVAQQNYYLWKTNLFERIDICETCDAGLYQVGIGCVRPRYQTNPPLPNYDYECKGRCWDIIDKNDLNILSDELTNGKKTVGRLIQKVPYYRNEGGLIEIQQYCITQLAYRYYDLLRQQSQTTGTLTDTPPAALVGNVRNLSNENEVIVGLFSAAGLAKRRHWIARGKDPTAIQITVLGHPINFEPTSLTRPPLAPCINGPYRTPFRPDGWLGD